MPHDILFNEPALHSLKRQQLVQLCKRYGLKASGKNTELQKRLKDYGAALSTEQRQENADDTTLSASRELDELDDLSDDTSNSSDPTSDTQTHQAATSTMQSAIVRTTPIIPRRNQPLTRDSTGSDTWDLLDRSGETEDSAICQSAPRMDGNQRWKSAANGSAGSSSKDLSKEAEETIYGTLSRGKSLRDRVGTIRAAGSSLNLRLRNASASSLGSLSLKRKASSSVLVRRDDGGEMSTRGSVGLGRSERQDVQSMHSRRVDEERSFPESARSVGVPKRHEHMIGLTAPSTIRLVTKNTEAPPAAHGVHPMSRQLGKVADDSKQQDNDVVMEATEPKKTHGLKPFCRYPLKNSPSTRRINSLEKRVEPTIVPTPRRNHPSGTVAIAGSRVQESSKRSVMTTTATATTTMYPELPSDTEDETDLPIPGAFPTPTSSRRQQKQQQQQPTPEPFIFGTAATSAGITNEQFGMAGDAVLEEMNRKLRERGIVPIGEEMDRNEVLRTKGRTGGIGESGAVEGGKKKGRGRFDDVHARQFAKMPSISSGWKGRSTNNTRTALSAGNNGMKPTTKKKIATTSSGGGPVMTPGKRKAGEMTMDTLTDSHSGTIVNRATLQGQMSERPVEDSPRFKRIKTGCQAVSSSVAGVPQATLSSTVPANEVATRSRLGFLAASANSVKGTFSVIHDRLSNDRRAIGRKNGPSVASKTQPPQPPQLARSRSGFFGSSTAPLNGSLGGRRLSSETISKTPSGPPSMISSTTDRSGPLTEAPATGLSLAYDLHVRKSKSSQALSTFASSTGNNGSSHSSNLRTLSVGLATASRHAPPPPPFAALDKSSPLHSSVNRASIKGQDFGHSLSKPLPAPPRTISRTYSSSLLRPTASSLARMQATIPPPTRLGATPAGFKSFLVPSYQDSPTFSRVKAPSSAAGLPTPRAIAAQTATPSKKLTHLVPKSPHRRAMERHTAAGRANGGTGGATGGLKTKTSQARLAMGQKQREIEERRRARLQGGKTVL